MELRIYSDIHQEAKKHFNAPFFHIEEVGNEKEQILILAGDYLNIRDLKHEHVRENLKTLAQRFKKVLYVFGNHEYYHGKIGSRYDIQNIESIEQVNDNIYVLSRHKPTIIIDGVKFVGATLWTDLNKTHINTYEARTTSNDFKFITSAHKGFSKFKPADWITEHLRDLQWIKTQVTEDKDIPVVVVSHHAPNKDNIDVVDDPKGIYAKFYTSNQDDFILNNPNIKLWVYGHIHSPSSFYIGETRVFSNPQDYDLYVDQNPQRSLITI